MIADSVIDAARVSDLVHLIEDSGVELSKRGSEFVGLCPFHTERTPSFTVNRVKGVYYCFGCGAHGDAIDFVMRHEAVPFHEAVQSIVGNMRVRTAAPPTKQITRAVPKDEWIPIAPVPDDSPAPMQTFHFHGGNGGRKLKFSRRWEYFDADRRLIGYVCRFELPDGGKAVIPQSYCVNSKTGECSWRWKSFALPRPIYGLDNLVRNPKAQVIVVEGEKACDAGQELFLAAGIPQEKLIVVSWPGGGNAVGHADWTPLHGRKVGLWPDADQKLHVEGHLKVGELVAFIEQPGNVAMLDVFERIKERCDVVKFFLPPSSGVPDGWDLADDLPSAEFGLMKHIRTHAMDAADLQNGFSLIASNSMDGKIRPIWLVPSDDAAEIGCAEFAADVLAMREHDIAQRMDPRGVMLSPYCDLDGLIAAIKDAQRFLPNARLHALIPLELGDEAVRLAHEGGASVEILQDGRSWVEDILTRSGLKNLPLKNWADVQLEGDFEPAEPGQALAPAVPTRHEERRRLQQEENARIQEEEGAMIPANLTLDEMLERCVWLAEGEVVAYVISNRSQFLTYKEFCSLTANSVTLIESSAKPIPTAKLWQSDPRRRSAMTRTFRAGAGVFCADPEGNRAVNLWRPFVRWPAKASIELFENHVAYLFEDRNEREVFLDWCAHLEQMPGVLPHYGWLHIASHTGCGRNWLASVLARVWRGYVAPNVDLPGLLESPFNGSIARRLLAVVDEIQEGGNGNRRHTNRLTALLNAETRLINPKFGRQFYEFNSCRWLVFSNHANALPIDNTDRRWRVVGHSKPPRPVGDYERLYAALSDREFINAIGMFLRERDISGFNPGERPPLNDAKAAVIDASRSMQTILADELRDRWPADIILNDHVAEILADQKGASYTPAMRQAMAEIGAIALADQIKIDGKARRGWILRNRETWVQAAKNDLRQEICRAGVNNSRPALAVFDSSRDDESS